MERPIKLKRTIKFGSGVDAKIYEEGVLKPPLPSEIIEEMNAGNPNIVPFNEERVTHPVYDYTSEMEVKKPDMSMYKTTATTVVKTDVGNKDKPKPVAQVLEFKPKLIKRKKAKLIRRRKKL